MAPPAKKAITPTASATGPESESLTLLSGVSQGRPPPDEAKAGSVRTITAAAATSVSRTRFRVLSDITELLSVEVGEDVLSGSHAFDGDELSDPARGLGALDRHHDVDRLGEEMRHGPLAHLSDQLLHPGERRARVVRVDGREASRMAGVPGFQKGEGRPVPNLADD